MRIFEFCMPTKGNTVPDGPDWVHEVKYDGYRLRLERDGERVRLITRGGYNWTTRYLWMSRQRGRSARSSSFWMVKLSCSGSTAYPISTPFTLAGMTKMFSSVRSIFWQRAAKTFASSRSRCGRR